MIGLSGLNSSEQSFDIYHVFRQYDVLYLFETEAVSAVVEEMQD